MSDTQVLLVSLAAGALMVAMLAIWRESRRRRRDDPDAVGWVDWTLVQMVALMIAALAVWLALKA